MATNSTIYGTESIMLGFVNKAKRGKEPVRFLSPFAFSNGREIVYFKLSNHVFMSS